jgi:NADH dehydrogenase
MQSMYRSNVRPDVVIVGGGFGGLTAARALRRTRARVTLIDRTNHHLFQPLLYQVATAGLSPAHIAAPIRGVLSRNANAHVLLADVLRVELRARKVVLTDGELAYDFLILAAGAQTSYFGHDEWAAHAPGLKTLEDATNIRSRVLLAYERAERETDERKRRELLTFVVIGGGPTGVEIAGSLAELARFVLKRDFRAIASEQARVILVEAGPRILPTFSGIASAMAHRQLEDLGVEIRVGAPVTDIDGSGVEFGDAFLPASTVVWAAGVGVSPLSKSLGVPLDPSGRVIVGLDLSLPGYADAFAIGDMARFEQNGAPLPGISPVAMQQARAVARAIDASIRGRPRPAFRYRDKGAMATIGRSRAVADLKRTRLSGFVAWLAWLFVHVWYLMGFRNRTVVLIEWAWSYFTYGRGARLIVGGGAARTQLSSRSLSEPKLEICE